MSSTHDGTPAAGLRNAAWMKSSHSGPTGGNCVELAHLPGGRVAVRHSREPDGPALVFSPAEWDAFLAGAKDGEFDRPALGLRPGPAEIRTLGYPYPRGIAQARTAAGEIRTLGYTGRHRAGPAAQRPGGGTVARRSLGGRGVPAA
jgi:hypothetical protein